jgi:hypothetical protein
LGIGDGMRGIMGARFDLILAEWGQPMTIIRAGGNATVTLYLDQPLPDRDQAPKLHEYDLVARAGEPEDTPLAPGELICDGSGGYYITRTLRQEPPIVVGQAWRCNAVATVYRATKVKDIVTGVTGSTTGPAETGIHCRITLHPGTQSTQKEGAPLQGEGRWMTEETYSVCAPADVLQAGDELEAPGWPRLKIGRPAMGDGSDPSWEVPATPVLPRGVPGREV